MKTSMAVTLFALAELIAKGKVPEPASVSVNERSPMVTLRSLEDQDAWARVLRFPAEQRATQPQPSLGRLVRVMWADWRGVELSLYYSVEAPAEQVEQVAA